ncbi:hypothetical protein DACRYDRAFT_84417 [Dacryopinax primogenitus]|uniref:Glyoxylate reductase n=1 Tax=Dacryopinax primogenitus (strain DJM 731) TaxID=1858805 RepID=M5FX19_DACPD|nr:uncharacterized protein DACRYDRAFT_84417 [Dacryopinax primogenitus]EJT98011.1 hypothetical protein DACRYDRAFT_84417 [Dacryopinax primogenitus]
MPGAVWQGLVNEELIGCLQGSLKYINGHGAGFDHVDMDWVTNELGAYYVNSPNAVSHPTATTTTMLILDCVRWTSQLELSTRRGEWKGGAGLTNDTRDMVVGIVGMGTIGRIVRDQIQAFGSKVIYSNRRQLPEAEENGAKYVSFEELLSTADVISLNCPLTPDTFHLIGEKEFSRMKQGVMIVNTSRGKVIDEPALVAALKSGHVARAGLDVYENEPHPHPELLSCERCTVLPHHGGGTQRVVHDAELEILGNMRAFFENGTAENAVNNP